MAKQPSVITGALKQPFAEQVAYFRNKMGNLVPTRRWTDMQGEEHDLGFMVAGAQKADLLSDLAAAVDRAISEGKSLGAFRKDFFNIVERRGWHNYTGSKTAKGRAWRTSVIYHTNLATSYAAGRRAQLIEADFDLWVYKHGGTRNPREQHLAWDGLTLPKDHPFWDTHYPPAQNVYGCGCYVLGAYSDAAARRLGADPDKTLPDTWQPDADTPGYPLGERVASVVSALAKKLEQQPRPIATDLLGSMVANNAFSQWLAKPVAGSAWPLLIIPGKDAALLGTEKNIIAKLSSETVEKQKHRHPELTATEYIGAQSVVDHSTAQNLVENTDRQGHKTGTQSLIYIREVSEGEQGGYVLVVKATKTQDEVFITSYYRLSKDEAKRDKEIRRLLKK